MMAEPVAKMDIDGLRSRLSCAQDLARGGGRAALEFRRSASLETLKVTAKGRQDFVTVADGRAEETIRTELASAFPPMVSWARKRGDRVDGQLLGRRPDRR